MRRAERAGGQVIGRQLAAGVEAEPADPQHAGAERRVGQVVRPHVFVAEADALADQQRTDQRRHAGADVHDGAAGEIERAAHQRRDARQPERTPDMPPPHTQWHSGTVHDRAPQNHEQHHRAELHPLGKRAANQRRRDDEEHALEQHVREPRNVRRRRRSRLDGRVGAFGPSCARRPS